MTTDPYFQSPKSASHNALNQLTSVSSATEMIVRGSVNEAATVTVGGKAATLHGGGEFSAKVPVTAGELGVGRQILTGDSHDSPSVNK